ncbi:MAG: hypothetical protein KDA74_25455, partial [Planctomycetaceae bacterium]|nr:hypothetical protein [Planctomycetaceae bacterium]
RYIRQFHTYFRAPSLNEGSSFAFKFVVKSPKKIGTPFILDLRALQRIRRGEMGGGSNQIASLYAQMRKHTISMKNESTTLSRKSSEHRDDKPTT